MALPLKACRRSPQQQAGFRQLRAAVLGFMIGFSLVMWIAGPLPSALVIVGAIVVGAIPASVGCLLLRPALYFAGGILGITIALALLGLIGVTGSDLGGFGWIVLLAGEIRQGRRTRGA